MKNILFKKEYLPQIMTGEKSQTIRCLKRQIYSVGMKCTINFDKNMILKIIKISHKYFVGLTLEEIKKDGFNNSAEFAEKLKEYYGVYFDKKILTLVEFEYLNKEKIDET